ncbi:MAG: SixA phosphatase family protein [Caulobacteraceae bacterium]
MDRLILFRHAKAEPRSADGEDVDRPLTRRGCEDAALMGRLVARERLSPDLALVSTAARALQTWTCARLAFPDAAVEFREELYNASAEELASELDHVPDGAAKVMIIGHNPGLQELAVNLLIESGGPAAQIERVSSHFSTATVASFRIGQAGRAVFDGLFHARDHGGEGD